jgi:hypothetical protein
MNEAVPRLVPADALRPLLDFHAPVIAHAPVIVFLLVDSDISWTDPAALTFPE